ncbi:hypothetical protein Vretimale_15864 [Volvox reticuliferus]|uniref:Uncharacterized protein n=1 Tax=Volvox reticuliferus TaxID=1737510 RepID=A0A8J4LWR1_9CHLO|nr:hypothetical protein Vretifemale_12923 [Volvox reticuliferus]GIM12543.1 hypothetical protein Vretimale_15864 [Volvox reticuliferus]
MCAGRPYVLGILVLATFAVSATCNCMPNSICSGNDLVVALQSDSVSAAQLSRDVRLASSDWPAIPIIRKKNFTLIGSGASSVLLDFSGVAGRLTLAPGVVLTLQDLEYRNAGTGVGYGLALLNPSPGARVELRNVAVFAFVCLPFPFLVALIRGYSAHMPPGYALDAQQRISAASAWCRTTPAVRRCYNSTIALTRTVLPLDKSTSSETRYADSGNGGAAVNVTGLMPTTSTTAYGSRYALVAYNSTLVCQECTPASCGWQRGYSDCLTSRWAQLSAEDDVWALLEASSTAPENDNASGGGGGGGEISTTQRALIISGGVCACVCMCVCV